MEPAPSVSEILPGVFRWEMFSPEHKVELTAHAVAVAGELFCFDPIPLEEAPLASLTRRTRPVAIILTNENHERDARNWRGRFQVPVWADIDAGVEVGNVHRFRPGQSEWNGWRVQRVRGGGGGEMAFRRPELSLAILGDAVINLPPRGLEVLPDKYCRDPRALRESLREFVGEPFERLLTAHGAPVLSGASARLGALL